MTVESYTTESAAPAKASRGAAVGPANATGRRKEAIARVRLVPGTGRWTINGRELANYFPNKLRQQDVNEPFRISELEGRYDVIATITGGGMRFTPTDWGLYVESPFSVGR